MRLSCQHITALTQGAAYVRGKDSRARGKSTSQLGKSMRCGARRSSSDANSGAYAAGTAPAKSLVMMRYRIANPGDTTMESKSELVVEVMENAAESGCFNGCYGCHAG